MFFGLHNQETRELLKHARECGKKFISITESNMAKKEKIPTHLRIALDDCDRAIQKIQDRKYVNMLKMVNFFLRKKQRLLLEHEIYA